MNPLLIKTQWGTSLVVQWLRFCPFSAGGMEIRIPHTMRLSQNKKIEVLCIFPSHSPQPNTWETLSSRKVARRVLFITVQQLLGFRLLFLPSVIFPFFEEVRGEEGLTTWYLISNIFTLGPWIFEYASLKSKNMFLQNRDNIITVKRLNINTVVSHMYSRYEYIHIQIFRLFFLDAFYSEAVCDWFCALSETITSV